MQKYNVQVDNQIHKIKVDSLFPIRFANTILSQLPRTCFAVLVYLDHSTVALLGDIDEFILIYLFLYSILVLGHQRGQEAVAGGCWEKEA